MSSEASTIRCHFNPQTRDLSFSPLAVLGNEKDVSMDAITFDCPATYGGLRLANFDIRIRYINAKGQRGVYIPIDVAEAGDKLTFTWRVSEHAMRFKGVVRFSVTFMLTDSATIVQQFSSKVAKVPVYGIVEAANMPSDTEMQDIIEAIFGKIEPVIDERITQALKSATDNCITDVQTSTLEVGLEGNGSGKTLTIDATCASHDDINILFE